MRSARSPPSKARACSTSRIMTNCSSAIGTRRSSSSAITASAASTPRSTSGSRGSAIYTTCAAVSTPGRCSSIRPCRATEPSRASPYAPHGRLSYCRKAVLNRYRTLVGPRGCVALFGSGRQAVQSSEDRQETTTMHIEKDANDGAVVLALYGRLTGDADTLIREVSRAARDGCRKVVVDLGGVSTIDAGGLGALVTVYRVSVASPLAVSLARASRRVRELLTITHLTRLLPIFDSVEEERSRTSIEAVRAMVRQESASA